MREKRGQAAMEFLMTYGWAILAAVIVIGVLASFGVFSPKLPTACVLSPPFYCVAVAADTVGVDIEVRNGAGGTVTVTNLTLEGCTPVAGTYVMVDQNVTIFSIPCALISGENFQGDLTVIYTTAGSTLEQISSASITVEVK